MGPMDEMDPMAEEGEEFSFDEQQAVMELLQDLMGHAAKQHSQEVGKRYAPAPEPTPEAEALPTDAPVEEDEPTDEELAALLG